MKLPSPVALFMILMSILMILFILHSLTERNAKAIQGAEVRIKAIETQLAAKQ